MRCPRCKSENVAKILYGFPDFNKKLGAGIASGKIVLGGCEVDPLFPKLRCNKCFYEFSYGDSYAEPDEFDKKVMPVIEAYIEKYGHGLPVDFPNRLTDPDDEDEWARVIQKAIDTNKCFKEEGVFDEDDEDDGLIIDDREITRLEKELGL